jgi:uncharacterized protein YfaS (alpha-2-macroglobulin family)
MPPAKVLVAAFLTMLVFIFVPVLLDAQRPEINYTHQWKLVDSLENKGLTRSALGEVDKMYTSARKSNDDPQVIKCLLYKITLQQTLAEDASVKSIDTLESESTMAKEPAKSILESITAQMYQNLLQQNRFRLYDRTNTVDFNKKDIATWTAGDLNQKIGELYLASIKNDALLKQTKLDPYDAIILKGNVRYLRPTLYDLLTHRALSYFNNEEPEITRPAYAFEIRDKEALAPAAQFIEHHFVSNDSFSLHYKALLIFQDLLSFHRNDPKPDALIDVDIERLGFAHQYGVMDDKDTLYLQALQNIGQRYKDNPASTQAAFLAAQQIYNAASASEDDDDDDNGKLSSYTVQQAKLLLDDIVRRFPESEGGINSRNLITQILHPEIKLTTENVNIPGFPFRTLVTYRNFKTAYFRIISLSPQLKISLDSSYFDNSLIFRKLTNANALRAWKQDLPASEDYLKHSVEVKIDALPAGEYVLLACGTADFSMAKNPLVSQVFYVSDISYVCNSSEDFVLSRTNGQPLGGAIVKLWHGGDDSYSPHFANHSKNMQLIKADKNGHFNIPSSNAPYPNNQFRLEISYKQDHLFLRDGEYNFSYDGDENTDSEYDDQKQFDITNARVFLFSDRSIYRPGQLVYFKGIGVTAYYQTKKTKLLESKDSLTVILTDANRDDDIDSMKVALNEFGSFNGKFRLPENQLNGEYTISIEEMEESSLSFSVEEYKRPKFYTQLEKIKEGYRVNDTVKVTGFAKGYAGNNIDGAKVHFRVTRAARFLYSWMFWRKRAPGVRPLEITHGEITTGTDGSFTIQFVAIPDPRLDKTTDPVFDYKIEADVTDINGETRSGNITVPVGYKALNLQISFAFSEIMNIDSIKNIFLTSKNLAEKLVPVKAELKIYKLQAPGRLIRQRLWEPPDKFILSKDEFIRDFPHDEYAEESKKESWPRASLVYSKTDSTNLVGGWHLIPKNSAVMFTQGWYVAEATAKDTYGQEVKDIKYFQVYDNKSHALPAPSYIWNVKQTNTVEPGESAQFVTGTSASDVFLIEEVRRQQTYNRRMPYRDKTSSILDFISLNENKKTFDFPISEKDRGGFKVNQFFVKDNRLYSFSNDIYVPWSNKELDISFDTYRDKTLPGSEEQWKVTVLGKKGEKAGAEMLASMYDASLDQFKTHSWRRLDLWPTYVGYDQWDGDKNFSAVQSKEKYWVADYVEQKEETYDALNFIPVSYYPDFRNRNSPLVSRMASPGQGVMEEVVVTAVGAKKVSTPVYDSLGNVLGFKNSTIDGKPTTAIDQSQIQVRKNFNETAFFYPDLRTDKEGNIEFSFTMPEALTKWKLMAFAHTKDLATGYAEKTVVTQKDLMVQPNAPRFLREGDRMEFSAKIVNMGNKELTGQAEFQLLNAATMNPVDGWFKNISPSQYFTVGAGQSTLVKFHIEIPYNFNNSVVYRIVAKAGNLSDGEEAAIPVVTNRMLVTETMPLPMSGEGTKNFKLDKLIGSGKSETLTNYGLTLEYTTNPAWYAIQALPYLMEFPHECAEQTFNRFYANAIASRIVGSSPRIREIFERWKNADTSALLSNLQKNEELKSVLLQETPWVFEAQSEEQQKKNIALLFDMTKMALQAKSTLDKLADMQSSNGGFAWFPGDRDDRYLTQYIVSGLGHLKKLKAFTAEYEEALQQITDKAIPYLDGELKNDYDGLIRFRANLKNNNLSALETEYLYMRSFFPEYPIAKEAKTAYNYYREQAKKYWLSQSKYMQAMIALYLSRSGDEITARNILASLKENAIVSEEMGMYWKEWNVGGYWWYQAPIESQAMMIEAFSEIGKDPVVIAALKTWLLKNKQTNNWRTTRATSEACYALLLQGTDWLLKENIVTIQLGSTRFRSTDEKQEAGSGYFKRKIDGDKVKPEMGNISVTVAAQDDTHVPFPTSNKPSSLGPPSWGAVYWQYFENLDKITFAETPLKLSKKLFIEKNTDKGPVLIPVNDGTELKVGDKIKVRIELRADRDMEYVHMKDMRASCMEPTNVLSEYKYQGGLGYYETTKDVSTNFFFSYLYKGTYFFEYPMFVTHAGNFSNGVTTIQCMYAPEFTAHSEGVRVNVAE